MGSTGCAIGEGRNVESVDDVGGLQRSTACVHGSGVVFERLAIFPLIRSKHTALHHCSHNTYTSFPF